MARPELSIRVSAEPDARAAAAQRFRASHSRSPPPRETTASPLSPMLGLPPGLSRAVSPPLTRPTPPPGKPTPPPKDESTYTISKTNWSPASRTTLPSSMSSPPSGSKLLSTPSDTAQVYLYRNSSTTAISHGPKNAAKEAKKGPVEVLLNEAWRPAWLRKRVLGAFMLVFALLVVAAELVACFEDGDAAVMSVEGLWTFGPVIIVSIITALWCRVEFQALNYTPWMVLNQQVGFPLKTKRQDASKTLLLDYIGMGYVQGLYAAIRNRHYIAAASLSTALLLRVQIILSTGLFRVDVGETGSKLLIVNPGNVHTMAAIFGLMTLVTLPMLPRAPTKIGIAPRDPTTIAGTAVLFVNSQALLSELRDAGTKEVSAIAAKIRGPWAASLVRRTGRKPQDSYAYQIQALETDSPVPLGKMKQKQGEQKSGPPYRPWTLQLGALIASLAFSAALICGLWVLFQVRDADNPFYTDGEEYFLWTSLVTLFFVALAFYLSRRAFDTRRLAPYVKLATRECRFHEALGLAYTNEFSPITLLKSLRHRDWAVFFATWLAILGWLMPIFSAGLFATSRTTKELGVDLRYETYFNPDSELAGLQPDDELVQNILIKDTAEYPAWTYKDLAIPVLELDVSDELWASSTKRFPVTVPATRSILDCETVSFSDGKGLDLGCKPLSEDSDDFSECASGQSYLGYVASSCSELSGNASYNYIWGDCGKDGAVTALMCNETIVEVDADVTLMCDNLELDFSFGSIPTLREGSQRSANITLGINSTYDVLQNITTSTDEGAAGLDPFFSTLVQSRLRVSPQRLGTEERTNSVIEAIKLQHSIIRAQSLNSEAIRSPFSFASPPPPPPIRATLDYFTTMVSQSAPQTYALTALLGLALLISAATLPARSRGSALPKNPSSIAAQASLLADSTLWTHLPAGAEWFSDDKLAHRLRKKTFRMGWFDGLAAGRNETPGRNYTIGIVQDEKRTPRIELEGDLAVTHMPDIMERSETSEVRS